MEQAMMGAGGGGKKQREVYVGNLTIGSVNDVMLRELFNGALAHLMPDAATNPPVVNVAMDPSGAFVHCSCPPLCIAAIWEYMWGGKHCSASGTSELDMVRLSVVSPSEEACMKVVWLACRALRLCGDADGGARLQRHGHGQGGSVRPLHQRRATQGICGAASGGAQGPPH